jgi:hypothetical protein
MSYNYTLKYRTFSQLLDEVFVDFQNYNLQAYIEPHQLIKVAKRVNYDLGLRIFTTKEAVLQIEKGRVKLPDDFFVLNFALICEDVTIHQATPQGTWIEERPLVTPYRETPKVIDVCAPPTVNCQTCKQSTCSCQSSTCQTACNIDGTCTGEFDPNAPFGNYCNKPRVMLNCKNECYELVQVVRSEMRTYRRLRQVRIINNAQNIDCDCPNLYWNVPENAWIRDNYIYTNFDCGELYINYQGMLEDDDGNLLVPDHDMINEYYEYALKQRILENLIMNDEMAAAQKLQLIEQRYRAARNYALSIVNTPNFSEMKQLWEMNRRAQYAKYYNMFKSYPSSQRNSGNLGAVMPNSNFPNNIIR